MSSGEPGARPVARVCLFCGANVGARAAYAQSARAFGAILAREGLALVYGGGSVGLMNEASSVRSVVYDFKRDFLAACERLQAVLG